MYLDLPDEEFRRRILATVADLERQVREEEFAKGRHGVAERVARQFLERLRHADR